MIYLVYCLVIVCATSLGAVAGLGGGVIIKPLLDLIGYHDAATIGMLSSVAVFTMCVVSLAKQAKAGFSFDRTVVVAISLGSLAGGLVGEQVFSVATAQLDSDLVKAVQAAVLALTLVLILAYTLAQDRLPSWQVKSPVAIFCAGLFLGAVSVFLGIGGGPLNVACMGLLFSYGMKEATVYSLATIFFSQLSKLGANALSGELWSLDAGFVLAVVVPAVAGGLIGTRINQRVSDEVVRRIYLGIMVALLVLSCFNCARGLGMVG